MAGTPMVHLRVLGMLEGEAKDALDVLGWTASLRLQLGQENARARQCVQHDGRTPDRLGDRLVEHFAVVPATEGPLQVRQPSELPLHRFETEVVEKLQAISEVLGGDPKRVEVGDGLGVLRAGQGGLPLGPCTGRDCRPPRPLPRSAVRR